MVATPLADAYLDAGGSGDADALEPTLRKLVQTATRALPELSVPDLTITRVIARHVQEGDPAGLEDAGVLELVLARACADGDPKALALFEARYMDVIGPALAHMNLDAARVSDVAQHVRNTLLVAAPGEQPRLVQYAGQGRLRGLVKVTAVRTAISVLRKTKGTAAAGPDDLQRLADPVDDPELHFLKAHYRDAFRRAFARAVGQLASRDRNILRMHLLGGMTLEQVATVYGINRSTVVRSLQKIRKTLYTATRDGLREEVAVPRSEFESVLGLLRSRFDVSLGRLLETVHPE